MRHLTEAVIDRQPKRKVPQPALLRVDFAGRLDEVRDTIPHAQLDQLAPAIRAGDFGRIFIALRFAVDSGPRTRLARPSVAQELAAQVIGVNSFELPGLPSGVDREIIGQLPSGFCVATRKSIPRLISGRSAV